MEPPEENSAQLEIQPGVLSHNDSAELEQVPSTDTVLENHVDVNVPFEYNIETHKESFGKPFMETVDNITADTPKESSYLILKDVNSIPRKTRRLPPRIMPRYLPDVDGNMWKCWKYPFNVELSSDNEYCTDEDPPYTEPNYTQTIAGFPEYGPKIFWRITHLVKRILIVLDGIALIIIFYKSARDWIHKRTAGSADEDSESESD